MSTLHNFVLKMFTDTLHCATSKMKTKIPVWEEILVNFLHGTEALGSGMLLACQLLTLNLTVLKKNFSDTQGMCCLFLGYKVEHCTAFKDFLPLFTVQNWTQDVVFWLRLADDMVKIFRGVNENTKSKVQVDFASESKKSSKIKITWLQ